MRPGRQSPLGDAALLLCAVIWGTTFLLTKQAMDHASPVLFVAARFGLATLVLVPLALRPSLASLWAARRWGVGIGLAIALGFWLQTWALGHIGPSRSAFLTTFYVFFTVGLEWLVFRRRPGKGVAGGSLLALVGVGLMTGAGWGEPINLGDWATLLCALVFAAQMIALSEALKRHASGQILFWEVATTAVLSLPVSLLFDNPPRIVWNGTIVFAVVYLAVVATGLVLWLQNYGQARTSASRAGVLFSSEPVWAALFAALFIGERLSAREIAGAGLVLAGLLAATLFPGTTAAAEPSTDPAAAAAPEGASRAVSGSAPGRD